MFLLPPFTAECSYPCFFIALITPSLCFRITLSPEARLFRSIPLPVFRVYILPDSSCTETLPNSASIAITVPVSVCCFSAATATPAKEIINSAISCIGNIVFIYVFLSFYFIISVFTVSLYSTASCYNCD